MIHKTVALLAVLVLLVLLTPGLPAQSAAKPAQATSATAGAPEWKKTDTLQHLDYALKSLREAKTAIGQASEDKPEPGHKDKALKALQEAIDQTAAAQTYWKEADAKWEAEHKK